MEGSSTNVYPYRGYCCRRYTDPEGNLCRVPDVLQNSQKCRVLWYNCHRTHRSVGYCIQISQGNLGGVPDLFQNSQKCRVLWCNCHRTHRSIGYCGTAVTELTEEVLCRVKQRVTTPGIDLWVPYRTYPWKSFTLNMFFQCHVETQIKKKRMKSNLRAPRNNLS